MVTLPNSPFVLSLSKDVVAQRSEHASWFDRLTTNGGGCGDLRLSYPRLTAA